MEKTIKPVRSYYSGKEKFLVAVDCIIFGYDEGELKLLLMKRKVQPMAGQWSLIGSFIDAGEDLDQGAARVLKHSTGLENVFMDQLHCFGKVNRDPGDRVISIAYYALIRIEDHDGELLDGLGASWVSYHDRPPLIMDHDEMVEKALLELRNRVRNKSLAFELLPEKFTIPELRHFFEEIYQQSFDKRNFRKKILAFNILEKLDEKEKTSSKKGAFLYRFNKDQYREMKERKSFI